MFLYSNHFTDLFLTLFLGGKQGIFFCFLFVILVPVFTIILITKVTKPGVIYIELLSEDAYKESFDFEEYDDWDKRNLI